MYHICVSNIRRFIGLKCQQSIKNAVKKNLIKSLECPVHYTYSLVCIDGKMYYCLADLNTIQDISIFKLLIMH